jgi:hypothetical protein
VARSWPDLRQCPALGPSWTLNYDELVPGYPVAHKYQRFQNGLQTVELTVYVASDSPATAYALFLGIGSTHQAMPPIFERGPAGLGDYSARHSAGNRSRLLWTYANVAFDLSSAGSPSTSRLSPAGSRA